MNNNIISLDIGGTTFSSYLIDENLNILSKSSIDNIHNYSNQKDLINGIENQILGLLGEYNISLKDVLCLGISAPGPLDSKRGYILSTPNLLMLQNAPIVQLLKHKLSIPTFLENDANLFALGEWFNHYNKSDVVVGITLGTGLGLGVIINGRLFTGSHGMGAEYGISPYQSGMWEDVISIEGLETLCKVKNMQKKSPKDLFILASQGQKDALEVWNDFGEHLGIFTSHILNLLDPSVISFGGGLSNAFSFFSSSLLKQLELFSPTYKYNNPIIICSKNQLDSAHIGAAKFALSKIKK